MAFPDVDPSFLSRKSFLNKKNHLKDTDEAFDKPHLWYSTSEVIHALQLFIEGGNELSESNTFR